MGGVGKTTLLKQINKKLLQMKNDFDVVIWVVVSRDLQLDKIQEQIGEKIGLFDNKAWKGKNFEEKASDIFKVLGEKKFVLLMDGLWERVDLTKVGVPLPSPENSSKIVFTTRSLQICSLMGADKQFKVTGLSKNDAWRLFKALVGDETRHPEVLKLARGVSRWCYGLPLALVSIGRAMVSKKTPQEWSDVREVLRRSMTSYSGSDDQLKKDIRYNLKLSYDHLQNDMFKSCFLYCCLFPRNQRIKIRDLIDYWIGEGFLGEQSQGHYIIDVLLSVCLLEQPGVDDSSVEMHDWIHDMSLWIASKIEVEKGNCFFCIDTCKYTEAQVIEKATRMSLRNDDVIENLSDAPKFPHLQTLFLTCNNSEVISNNFFRFMPSLKALNLSGNHLVTKLPWGISNLISLQHLDLSYTGIEELPKELRALKKLKCLNLEKTDSLRTIPRQLISEFSMLNVLRLWECCFMLQSNEDSVVCNDAQLLIEELLCLKNLSMLSITLNNSHALQRLLSSSRLQSCIQSLCLRDLSHPKSIKVPLTDLKHLNELEISKCEYLEELEVDFVGEAQSPCSFFFLGEVIIRECRKLRQLTWLILAPSLKHLEISYCDEMEEIINVGKLSDCPELMGNVIPFSKLKFLTLRNLPKLRRIYWTDLPFPDLKAKPDITDCPMLPDFPVPPRLLKSGSIESLYLRTAIEEVPSPIQRLTSLIELDLAQRTRLKHTLTSICKLKSLSTAYPTYCSQLETFPDIMETMESLVSLDLRGSAIKWLPPSIESKNLEMLPSSICNLSGLKTLRLNNCSLMEIPEDIGCLSSLKELELCRYMFESLPKSIKKLSKLKLLSLRDCKMLQSIPELPARLECLDAMDCNQLCQVLDASEFVRCINSESHFSDRHHHLVAFIFTNPLNLKAVSNVFEESLLIMRRTEKGSRKPPNEFSIFLPGNRIPEWFCYQSLGSSVNIQVLWNDLVNRKVMGIAICAVLGFEEYYNIGEQYMLGVYCDFIVYHDHIEVTSGSRYYPTNKPGDPGVFKDSEHMLLGYCSSSSFYSTFQNPKKLLAGDSDYVNISIKFEIHGTCQLKRCGVHLIYAEEPIQKIGATIQEIEETSRRRNDPSDDNGEEVEPHPKRHPIYAEEPMQIIGATIQEIEESSGRRSDQSDDDEEEVEPHPKRHPIYAEEPIQKIGATIQEIEETSGRRSDRSDDDEEEVEPHPKRYPIHAEEPIQKIGATIQEIEETSGRRSDRSDDDEEEVEPHPKRIV